MTSKVLYFSVYRLTLLPRTLKRLVMMIADALVAPLLIWVAFALRLSELQPNIQDPWLFLAAPAILVPALYIAGFYRSMIRYVGAEVAWSMFAGVSAAVVLLAAASYMVPATWVPRSVFLIWGALSLLYLGGCRFVLRRFLVHVLGGVFDRQPVAVFGAGSAGAQLVAALQSSAEFFPSLIVDDAAGKHGTLMAGVPVVGREKLEKMARRGNVSAVLLAVPSLTRTSRMAIVRWLETLNLRVQTVPAFTDIASGKARIEEVRDVAIEDLLGRDAVPPRQDLLHGCITGKAVLVTGAGGSIGSELCRQILRLEPSRLILFEQSEFSLYAVERELRDYLEGAGISVEIEAMLGSVVNKGHVERVCRRYAVQTVYHAAAYKHVPIVEANPAAGVRNNIIGTLEAALGAEAAGVRHFILVSTDKAVRPTNVMGATKRFAEQVLQAMAERGSDTIFTMVRFGNVLGSSGSVVPLFREQIRDGGPVTVTHPDVIRYFMTIPEASQLVIQAGAMAKGGEVFVLDMGDPVKIVDLATTMVHLMGYSVRDVDNPSGEIEIRFTGLRPGEKLYEELLIGESSVGTEHEMILQAFEEKLSWAEVLRAIESFRECLDVADGARLKGLLRQYVKGYEPGGAGVEKPEGLGTRELPRLVVNKDSIE
ncbi:MAG: polysaccharide biosynthesis protein [Pseudomonadales bacterium]|uniref:polysaccharide biosynthesis protein n=1 Tax=Alcanivorax sp. MD8A TaxID=1177157 RepID=UPI000CB76377|nr:nucleoside-diphosphate sugar epimerase/dehydratase [Alcanivorax sp. MD8A]MCG8436495.1 polysaccharide biosynthesis protein [Pseudomonadales bacterium]PNE02494.1 polysaccharide biosynthesis protein [Alcanivorax sp. MD8A]